MDSPLNLAHQQARRADMMLKARRFEEASTAHRRAAEYLLETMQLTPSVQALESLRLQHKHHLWQNELIEERQQKAEREQLQKQAPPEMTQSKACQTESEPPNPTSGDKILEPGQWNTQLEDDSNVYHTLSEADSLLEYLMRRIQNVEGLEPYSLHYKSKDQVHEGLPHKLPKDDKIVVEEFRVQNEELRKHILLLLQEAEDGARENQELRRQLDQAENSKRLQDVEAFFDMDEEHMKLPSLDLPPLEMPKFDFSSLKEESEKTENDMFVGKQSL